MFQKRTDLAQELRENIIAEAKSDSGETALHKAASDGSNDKIAILLDKGADVNAKDMHGITPLHLAVQKGHIDTVKLLLERGADINAKIIDGQYAGCTPIDIAKQDNKKEIAKLFENQK